MARSVTERIEIDGAAALELSWLFTPEEIGCALRILLQFYQQARRFKFWDHPVARRTLLGEAAENWSRDRPRILSCFEELRAASAVTTADSRKAIPAAVRKLVYDRDGGACVYCRDKVGEDEFHCDHVEPRSRGGTDEPGNLVCSCIPCNLEKAAKTLEEWRARP